MAHVRKQIREAAAALLTGLTTTGARVYQSRVYPLKAADLPGLIVLTDEEEVLVEAIGSPLLQRTLKLTVRCVALATADLDDTLDLMLQEVEAVLNGALFGGLAKNTVLESIRIQMTDDLEKPAGVADAVFAITYLTGANPGTAL